MMHDFAKNGKKKRRIVQHDTAFYGLEGSRTLDLSDANRTLSQLSYEPIFKPPKTAWGRVVYNSRLFKDRMGSQLSYRPMMMTLIVYRVLGRLSSNFGEHKRGLTSGQAARRLRRWRRLR